jgi:hypothetical protein
LRRTVFLCTALWSMHRRSFRACIVPTTINANLPICTSYDIEVFLEMRSAGCPHLTSIMIKTENGHILHSFFYLPLHPMLCSVQLTSHLLTALRPQSYIHSLLTAAGGLHVSSLPANNFSTMSSPHSAHLHAPQRPSIPSYRSGES